MNTIPASPGIYTFKGQDGILLYIGKASNLKTRVKNHFQVPSSRDHLFMDKVESVGILETPSEIEALLLESQLIKRFQPRYNVMWKDDKKYFYVAITKEIFPRVFITHQLPANSTSKSLETKFPKKSKVSYIGPFVDGKPLKQTLQILRPIFPYYTSKNTHSQVLCSYCHLEMCPGPYPNQKTYQKNIKNLVAILKGKRFSLLKKLGKEMRALSQAQQYEQAREIRDKIQALETVFTNAKVLQHYTPLKGVTNWTASEKWLRKAVESKKRISRMEAYDISNIQGKEATGSMVVFIDGNPAKQFYRRFKIHITGKANDYAMMKELLSRRISHKEWGFPELILIDGGKGQLSSAIQGLRKGNLVFQNLETKFPKVVALAKRNNELFMEGATTPLFLKDMPASVSNILLHIRDEAHRFAITYHRKLHAVAMKD